MAITRNLQSAARGRGWGVFASVCCLLSAGDLAGQSRPASQPITVSVEDEVVGNILNQRVGDRAIADDCLPDAFVRRLADRVIRASFQQRYRIVYDDRAGGTSQPGSAPRASTSGPAAEGMPVFVHRISRQELNFWSGLPEARPALRGFRAPIVRFGLGEPFGPLAAGTPEEVQRVADIVSRGLAKEGLLMTTARAMLSFGAGSFTTDTQNSCDVLALAGLPVDLLAYYGGDRTREGAWLSVARGLAKDLERGQSLDETVAKTAKLFAWGSPESFRSATDSGEGVFQTMRLQLTRGDYWGGEGDGGSVDVARQLLGGVQGVEYLISIEQQFAGALAETARGWPAGALRRTRVVTEPLAVSQWAQDDGRWGTLKARGSGELKRAILVPRYASRGEDGSILVPGDSLLLNGLGAAGETVLQSPLLFQGGNLIVFELPGQHGRRAMLAGEAELYRNMALGLSEREALEALRGEFGVDVCEVLPAVAYHIDYEVSVRRVGDGLVAFVNDTLAAARVIGDCGLSALEKSGIVSAPDAKRAREALAGGRYGEFLEIAARPVYARADDEGRFPVSLSDAFSTGATDSGVGNLRRFLVACDELAATLLETDDRAPGAHAAAYIRSLRRRSEDRTRLRSQLRKMGMRVAPIPSLSDEEQSINYINGLHDSKRLLMPAYGGLYAKLDEAAKAAFARVLGPGVEVISIGCAESQRRDGAVRCSVSVYTAGAAANSRSGQ